MTIARMGLSAVVLFGLSAAALAAEPVAGTVKTAQGNCSVRRGAEAIPAREGMHLLANDVLQTAAGGRLGAILQDGTRIALGPETELRIDSYIYQPADGKFGLLLRLMRGVLAYASGKIAQFAPESVRVETPAGFVGLRGTQFAVALDAL